MKKAESDHCERVASTGCVVCMNQGIDSPLVEIHHIGNGAMGKRASNYQVLPLCFNHHRGGGHGVAVHAGKKTWEANFGTEKELLAQVLEAIK